MPSAWAIFRICSSASCCSWRRRRVSRFFWTQASSGADRIPPGDGDASSFDFRRCAGLEEGRGGTTTLPENLDGRWLAMTVVLGVLLLLLLLLLEGLDMSYEGKSCKDPARLITIGSGTLISGAVLSKPVAVRSGISTEGPTESRTVDPNKTWAY